MSHHNHDATYIRTWAVLLVALLISLGLGIFAESSIAIGLIFAIAAVKAWLVLSRFMHMNREPRFLQMVMVGAVAAIACFFVGVYPDVARAWSVMPLKQAPPEGAPVEVVAVEPGDAARGAKVFSTYCVACHGTDGKANGGTTGANFVDDKSRLAKTDEELLQSIAEGKTGTIGTMPPWKAVLSPQQMSDVIVYLRTSFGGT